MGCDIHLAVEHRNGSGGWERALPPPEVYDSWLQEKAAEGEEWAKDRVKVTWFDDRNYNLFAILAGVRNRFDFEPISEPRGLPNDLSADVRALNEEEDADSLDAEMIGDESDETNDVNLGDHSHSWLTLRELLECNWNREIKEGGWVNPHNFVIWREKGKPDEWCRSVGGGMVEHLSWRDMGQYIADGYIKFTKDDPRGYTCIFDSIRQRTFYAYVEWPLTYKDAAGRFYKQIIPALQALGEPDDVRIVFGFDS